MLGIQLRLGAFTEALPREVIDGEGDAAVWLSGLGQARDAEKRQANTSK